MLLNRGAPNVNIMFSAINMAMVPTIGPIELFTNEDIISDSEATTNIDNNPKPKAKINRHQTSFSENTWTPLLKTIKSPFPNKTYPNPYVINAKNSSKLNV